MTQGLSAFFFLSLSSESASSSSLSLFLASSSSSGEGSRRTRAMRRPSGDQKKSSTSCAVSVSFSASPPRRFKSQICSLPSLREERKARNFPSGLQRGWEEEASSEVSAMGSEGAEAEL